MPAKLPIAPTVLAWLALDHWNAPEWLYGAFIALGALVWVISIWVITTQEEESVLDSKERKQSLSTETPPAKSKFMQKLDEAIKNGQIK